MLDTDSRDVKSAVRQLAETLPDDATWDDVMYRVYVHQAVDAGLRDAAEGRLVDVAEIQRAVQLLTKEELAVFSSWLDQFEEERWDRQLERDQKSGPLRSLMEKAKANFEAGKCSR